MNNREIKRLPNATAVLVLGISSILMWCCYGIPGIVTGIIALVLYRKDMAVYKKNTGDYPDVSNLRNGRNLSIIGIAVNILYVSYLIFVVSMGNSEAISNPGSIFKYIKDLF